MRFLMAERLGARKGGIMPGTTNPARRLRVGIVGGSIAGCAAAVALMRAGNSVTLFERSPDTLVGRGAGIGTQLRCCVPSSSAA
jgi:NADPH-dependent glutamate synthase beta subunit-like oxidoreductase